MKRKLPAYWWCQLGGWTFYTLAYLFLAFVFDQPILWLFVQRLILSVLLGFLVTHLFRIIIHRFKLFAPLTAAQWLKLFFIVSLICISYSLVYSTLVEWFQIYDPKMKTTVQKRFIFDLFYDAPIILIWVSIYYVWHYIEADRKGNLDKIRLEAMVKELELKTIKSHINPHFIFNSLNSIRALVDENPERARTAITELSNILRSSMQAEKIETLSLEKEL
ncbi:MAG: histidine kinase, partial [Parafilimonas sp.]